MGWCEITAIEVYLYITSPGFGLELGLGLELGFGLGLGLGLRLVFDPFPTRAVIMSASGRLSLFQRPLKRRLLGAYALMAAPQPYPQPYSSTKVAIATTVKTQKEEGGKDKGWPLSVKLVGIGIVAVATPSALKYAIENDWETRKAVEKWIPGGAC